MITAQSEGLEQISLMLRKAAEDTEILQGKSSGSQVRS